MIAYLLRRLLGAIPLLLGVLTLIFFVIHLAPGDPTALGIGTAAGVARYMRGAMLEVIHQDFIRTARAKGLSERSVIFKHALRNALIPIITLLGLYLPFLLSGAVLVETIFAWPGMGSTVMSAIFERDYPLVMATSFVIAAIVVLGNLLSDLLYAVVDPRIRNE